MRVVVHIFILIAVVTFFVIYNFSGANNHNSKSEIVIVGNDTLGRNWDNLPSAKEIEAARFKENANNATMNFNFGRQNEVTQKEDPNTFESIGFSNRIGESQNNRETIISDNGAEIVVGTYENY
ncbi:MAG TPA: hypothetical protein PLC61_02375 [Chitinophagales bacterium]|nr:hypothetical protein [Chitinophagales bacterium]HMV03460.1 hypothetical protein [Chitinophagales bacterium]HMW93589.1 hypothetical protein [Chitinophagales bacterium]HMY43082.1 hypothetical protein [Chitinophagales bacterium]HMZ68996.1 hypothetical protein [Chitinophagales bacterium]